MTWTSLSSGAVVALLALLGSAMGCPSARPCKTDAQCDAGDVCIPGDSGNTGTCGPGEGEGEGAAAEGEGSAGEGEGEGEGQTGTPTNVLSVTTGIGFQCVVDAARKVQCWGSNIDGQLGRVVQFGGADPVPAAVTGLAAVDRLVTAQAHSCAIGTVNNGPSTVVCWGDPTEGTLGRVGAVQLDELVEPNVDVGTLRAAVDIATDADNNGGLTCIVDDAGRVTCFGPRMPGFDPGIGVPVVVDALAGATSVFVNLEAICAHTAAGFVCTDLGNGAITHLGCADGAPCPAFDVDKRGVSHENVCVLTGNDLQCAGENVYGVADPANIASGDLPLTHVTSAIDVGLGLQHACAITTAFKIVCWGRSIELGTGRAPSDLALQNCGTAGERCQGPLEIDDAVVQAHRYSDLATRRSGHCARESDGAGVVCWGNDSAPVRTTFVAQP